MDIQIKSIKHNFILNNIRLFLNLLIPMIVFPYVSRVLGPEGLGKVEFANSVVAYFVLFTSLGIPTYGIREIARTRDNKENYSTIVYELSSILAVTCVIGYVLYFGLIYFIPNFRSELYLFFVVAPSIFFTDFSYDWFFQGIENQSYVTKRYIFVKIIQVTLIVLLVKESSQYILYGGILIGINGCATIFNIIHLKKYLVRIKKNSLNYKRHLKPIFAIFASAIAVSIYTNVDVTMVGLIVGDEAVGLYVTPNRIVRILIQCVTVLGSVMIPRLENFLANNKQDEYYVLLNKSLGFTLLFCVPIFFGVQIVAKDLILLFAGSQFEASILSLQLLSPILLFIPMAHFVGLQILYPHRMEYKYTIAVTVAAVINIVFNYFAIQKWQQNGAIVGTCVAELVGLIIQVLFGRKFIKKTELVSWNTGKIILAGFVMFGVLAGLKKIITISSIPINLLFDVGVGIILYGGSLVVLREKVILSLFSRKK